MTIFQHRNVFKLDAEVLGDEQEGFHDAKLLEQSILASAGGNLSIAMEIASSQGKMIS